MGEILIVCFLSLLQSRLEFRHGIKFFCPDKILFDCSDDSLRVGIAHLDCCSWRIFDEYQVQNRL